MVVMGSAGLAHRFPLGSTTEAVIRSSPASVLVVKG
jgi:nucleotide-binding universal stress UspA family protein